MKRRFGVDLKPFAERRHDFGRGIGPVADLAAEHFREQVAGGIMHGADDGQIALAIRAETVAAEAFVEHGLHAPLARDALVRMVKKVFVEGDAGLRVPP